MRALEFIIGHVIYNPASTYKFQLKTTIELHGAGTEELERKGNSSVASIFHIYRPFFLLIVCFVEIYVYL